MESGNTVTSETPRKVRKCKAGQTALKSLSYDDAYCCQCGYRFWIIAPNGIIICGRCRAQYLFPLQKLDNGILQIAEPRVFNAIRYKLLVTKIVAGMRYILKVGKQETKSKTE
jgi:hypothetical protein